jgi:hypothetical protein
MLAVKGELGDEMILLVRAHFLKLVRGEGLAEQTVWIT